MLELRDFITRTLEDVLGGIAAAQRSPNIGKHVAPGDLSNLQSFAPDSGVYAGQRFLATAVKFDVAIAAEAADKAGGKAGIKIAVFTAGVGGEIESRRGTTQRIQFSVPVIFPKQ